MKLFMVHSFQLVVPRYDQLGMFSRSLSHSNTNIAQCECCYLPSDDGAPCIRKGTHLLLLINGIMPPVQNTVICMHMFLPIRQK